MGTKRLEKVAQVRLTNRDQRIVRLVCEQGVVSATDLGAFMAATSGRSEIGQRTRNGVLARLRTVGLLTSHRWFFDSSALVYPTRLGARWVEWSGKIDRPPLSILNHELTAAAVRISAYPEQLGWSFLSERVIQKDQIPVGSHRPDGVASFGRHRSAIEIQLSVTDIERCFRVIDSHLDVFDAIHYWATPQAASLVQRTIEQKLPMVDRPRVQVRALGDLAR